MGARRIVIWLTGVAILVALVLVLILQMRKPKHVSDQVYWPTRNWRTGTPEEQGLDSAKLAEGLLDIQKKNIKIDSLLIIRNGSVILDAYFNDPYDGTLPHDLASVTKSFMTTLIGIAADQGKIQLDQTLVSYFPNRTIANLDAGKEQITIRHLAGMVNGFESGCLGSDMLSLDRMRSNPDWVQAALDRKMFSGPGTTFCYDSPGMHLLSAVLQEATGMTALEFARQYLFEPLGIEEVVWESDPQGYTHGWGDLHLKPRDAAKLGYLWLNHGLWDGKQIVSAAWVEDSVRPHSKAGDENYGYGWWVEEEGFYAMGRAGQSIKVYPSWKLIIVTTASNLEYDQINPYLVRAFVSPDKPLPPNPAGIAQLNEALATLTQTPFRTPIKPQPDNAKTISGKTYLFESNPVNVENLRFEFDDSAEATMYLRRMGSDVIWTIGLDGNFRLSSDGLGLGGYWEDTQTFVIQVFDIGLETLQFHFEEDRLLVEAPGLKFEGKIGNPE